MPSSTVPSIDQQSLQILSSLHTNLISVSPINSTLIENYLPSIDKSTIFPHTVEIESNEYLQSFFGIISQILTSADYSIIDPQNLTLQLLERILTYLTFEEITNFYPESFIIENLLNSNVQVSKLCLQIILLKSLEPRTISFLEDNDLLSTLVSQYLTNKSLDIGIVSQIETLLNMFVQSSQYSGIFILPLVSKNHDLYRSVRTGDMTLLARFLDYIVILLPFLLKNSTPFPSDLYLFTEEEFLNICQEDPLVAILVAQFYFKILEQESFESQIDIFPPIGNSSTQESFDFKPSLISLIKAYQKDTFDFIKDEIINTIAKLSYTAKYEPFCVKLLVKFEIVKAHNLIKLYEYDPQDIKLLSTLNPRIIVAANPQIYSDVLTNISLFSNNKYFPILLNFISIPTVFSSLTTYFHNTSLQKIPADKLYTLLFEFSKYSHSKHYLFNNLPTILNTFLIDDAELNLINKDLWNLKVQTLENLLDEQNLDDIQDLTFWKKNLNDSLNLMKYGRNLKDIAPRVDVMDETA